MTDDEHIYYFQDQQNFLLKQFVMVRKIQTEQKNSLSILPFFKMIIATQLDG